MTSVRQMIRENNRIREQMTPQNRSYYEDMIIAMRESAVEPHRREELLLEAAALLLKEQGRGRTAKQLFGSDPSAYFADEMAAAPPRRPMTRTLRMLLTAWTSLTLLFGVIGAAGLLTRKDEKLGGEFGHISLFTLLAVPAASILLIELLLKWLGTLPDADQPRLAAFDYRSLGLYIGAAVALVFVGLFLGSLLPVLPLPSGVSLGLFAAGVILLHPIFLRKR
ncbi:DUF1129 family protein [Paenibacillus glufosinatiresistens]|uniref:DUF1129 family protein n=1 Tax=Paenibacillus glufosinatiresistens TaxID=3070657 RepID=UPI00286DD2B1|nr:DUF1129 family protein [Paenibacillus sp. YX.27]